MENVEDVDRSKAIWRKKKGGMSHSQLASEYGITRQRINQICRREERREEIDRLQKMRSGE